MGQLDHVDDSICKSVLVVEPEYQLDGVLCQLASGLGVHHAGVRLADEEGAGAVLFAHQHPGIKQLREE